MNANLSQKNLNSRSVVRKLKRDNNRIKIVNNPDYPYMKSQCRTSNSMKGKYIQSHAQQNLSNICLGTRTIGTKYDTADTKKCKHTKTEYLKFNGRNIHVHERT